MTLASLTGDEIRFALREAGYLPAPLVEPVNRFRPARLIGEFCFVSSMTPIRADGSELHGQIGLDAGITDAEEASRWCIANSLAWLAAEIDSSDHRLVDVVDLLVYCNAVGGFEDQSVVADAASALLNAVLPDSVGHARGAIGAASLVRNSLVVAKATYQVVPMGS